MRRSAFAVLLAAAPLLAGCLTVSPRVLSTGSAAPLLRSLNRSQGTDFPERLLLTGYGVGAELPGGILGLHAVEMGTRVRSDNGVGTAQSVTVNVRDVTLVGGYPVRSFGAAAVLVGGEWTLRTTRIGGNEGTAFILRPRVTAAIGIGSRIVVSPNVSYDVPVIENETLFDNGDEPVRAALSGLNAGIGISYNFGLGWF